MHFGASSFVHLKNSSAPAALSARVYAQPAIDQADVELVAAAELVAGLVVAQVLRQLRAAARGLATNPGPFAKEK